jgi:hypothetical protein
MLLALFILSLLSNFSSRYVYPAILFTLPPNQDIIIIMDFVINPFRPLYSTVPQNKMIPIV